MKYKKILTLLLLILVGFSASLYGCGNKYANMTVELNKQEITVYLNEEEDTDTFVATVSGVKDDVSLDVNYIQSNPNVVSIQKSTVNENGETTFTVTALSGGHTNITVVTKEGDKRATVGVDVVERVTAMNYNTSYTPYVVAGNQAVINTAQAILFTPSTTTQKNVTYSLKGQTQGVSITSQGLISTDETTTANEFTVIATNTDADLSVEIPVKIIHAIDETDIQITSNGVTQNLITLVTNRTEESSIDLDIDVNTQENITISYSVSNTNVVELSKLNDQEINLQSGISGTATLTVTVSVVGYPNYKAIKNITVNVIELPNYVSVNGISTNQSLEIYDNYSNILGQKLTLQVGPVGAYDKRIKLGLDSADRNKITVTYADGTPVDIDNDILDNNTVIYVKVNSNYILPDENQSVVLSIIAYGTRDYAEQVQTDLTLNLRKGITQIGVEQNQYVAVGQESEINFSVNSDEYSKYYTIEIGDNTILSTDTTTVNYGDNSFIVTGLKEGITTVNIYAQNGFKTTISVRVYITIDAVSYVTDSPNTNSNIGDATYKQVSYENLTYPSLDTVAVAKGTAIDISLIKYQLVNNNLQQSLGNPAEISYSSSNSSIVAISNSGHIVAKSQGTVTITSTVTVFNETGSNELQTYEFTVTVYVPISQIALSESIATMYSLNSLGYYDLNDANKTITLAIYPTNATLDNVEIDWTSGLNLSGEVNENNNREYSIMASLLTGVNKYTSSVMAIVTQYKKSFLVKCIVTIKSATRVQDIGNLSYTANGFTTPLTEDLTNSNNYSIYLDDRDGISTMQLNATVLPSTAHNTEFVYKVTNLDGVNVVTVSNSGLLTVLRPGRCKIEIIAKDSYTDENNYTVYKTINYVYASGETEDLALRVSNLTDLMSINTNEVSLSKFYVLTNDIDVSSIANWQPIGIINGTDFGFSGNLNGQYTFNGVTKSYKISGLKFVLNTNSKNSTLGLFSSLNEGTVKNLNILVQKIDLILSSNETDSSLNFGVIAGVNESSSILNCLVTLPNSNSNSLINTANYLANIGGLVGVNNGGEINSCYVSGALKVVKLSSTDNLSTTYVGGMIGSNSANLTGGFEYFGNNEEAIFNNGEINSSVNLTVTQADGLNEVYDNSFGTVATGGIAGMNSGSLNGFSTSGTITAINNVGGIAGINEGTILNSFSYRVLSGYNYVGGISGFSTGRISFSVVNFFDEFDSSYSQTISPSIIGTDNVGGISGYASGTIFASFVKTYYNRTSSNYLGDLLLRETGGQSIGGLVGSSNQLQIEKSYSQSNVVSNNANANIGGLVGYARNTQITNSYTRGSLTVVNNSNANIGACVGNSAQTVSVTNFYSTISESLSGNDDILQTDSFVLSLNPQESWQKTEQELKDISTYANFNISNDEICANYSNIWNISSNYNDGYPVLVINDSAYIVESPTSITITVKNTDLTAESLTGGKHIKITDFSALVYLFNDANNNVIDINDLVSISFLPETSRPYFNIVSEDSTIATISGNLITVSKAGVVKIKFTSKLNNTLSGFVTLNIVNALTNFGLYENADLSSALTKINFVKGDNQTMYLGLSGLNNVYIEYETSSTQIYMLNHTNWVDNKVTLSSNEIQVLGGDTAISGVTLTVKPYIFAVDENAQSVKVYLPYTAQTITVNVHNGIDSISSNLYGATISLKDILNLSLTVVSDVPNEVTIPTQDIIVYLQEDDYTGYTDSDIESILNIVQETKTILGSNTVFGFEINTTTNKNVLSVLSSLLAQSIAKGRNGVSLVVGFKASLEGIETEYQNVVITITPQSVYNIDTKFYSRAEKDQDGNYDFNEVPGNNIIAGRWGLMKLNVYPSNADIDEISISYSTSSSVAISMEQMVKVNDSSYSTLLPYSQPLASGKGLYLQLISNKITTLNNLNEEETSTDFDGYLYVNFIIQSSTPLNTEFTITVSATYSNGQVLTQTMKLYSDVPSEIELTHNGETDNTYMAINTEQNVKLMVSRLDVNNDGSNIVWKLKNLGTELVYGTDFTVENVSTVLNGYMTQINATLVLNGSSISVGSTLDLTASISKFINNKTEVYTSNDLSVYSCLYTVDDVIISMAGIDNGVLKQPYGSSYKLAVQLITTGDDTDLLTGSSALINQINESLLTWYATKSNNETNYITTENVYTNFKFEVENANIYIRPKYVSTGDLIYSIIRVSYRESGMLGIPVLINDTTNLADFDDGIMADGSVILSNSITTNFYSNTSYVNASPIQTVEDLENMLEGESYRLVNDIDITSSWTPLSTEIAYLDGNGYSINIKNGFNTNIDNTAEIVANYGLFSVVGENTKLYNLTVNVYSYVSNNNDTTKLTVDLTNSLFSEVNFGIIAGINNGILYNCTVNDISSYNGSTYILNISTTAGSTGVNAYIGGLVGTNNGYITNSYSMVDYVANRGNTGGLVGANYGTISSSKVVLDYYINNTSSTQLGSLIGGFVSINGAGGNIYLSYIEGKSVDTTLSATDGNNNRFRKTTSSVMGSFNVGGFVNENSGTINDCYSNIKIVSQNRSSGFVFTNKGSIDNCYTANYITENHTDHTPFTGTETGGTILNTGTITNSYYLEGNLGGTTNEIAKPLTVQNNAVAKSQFALFVFNSGNYNENCDGTWTMSTDDYSLPTLVDANLTVQNYTQAISSVDVDYETQEVTYNWIYETSNDVGTITNPYTISSANEFNNLISYDSNTAYFRIIKDITFTDTIQPTTTNIDFKGVLFGLDMQINNLNLIANSTSDTNYFGLFKEVNNSGIAESSLVLIKNLKINVENVYANNVVSVGTLAGKIENAVVNEITISGDDTVVQGRHFVGGLAGIINNSKIYKINVSTSVNASYRGNETAGTLYNSEVDPAEYAYDYSYAGTVAGIVTGNSVVKYAKVTGDSRVIGYYAGGVFGLVDTNSIVSQLQLIIDPTQFVRAYYVAGGLIGENRGTVDCSFIQYENSIQNTIDYSNSISNRNLTFFAGSPKVIGGLVGFNNNGTVTNSYSKVDVRNTLNTVIIAGGLVGTTVGGQIENSYATGSVLNNFVLGGLVGSITNRDSILAYGALFTETYTNSEGSQQISSISSNNETTIQSSMAFNNWLSTDFTTISSAKSKGLFVGLISTDLQDVTFAGNYMQTPSTTTSFGDGTNWQTGVGGVGSALIGTDMETYTGNAVASYYYQDPSYTLTWARIRNKSANYQLIYSSFTTEIFDKTFVNAYFPILKLNINL